MISQCSNCGGVGKIHIYRHFSTVGAYIRCKRCSRSTKTIFNVVIDDAKEEVETYWNNGFIR